MNANHRSIVWREFMAAALTGMSSAQDAKHAAAVATLAGKFADSALDEYERRHNDFNEFQKPESSASSGLPNTGSTHRE